jgi:lyso-ornithine lipid O-acyltransferase
MDSIASATPERLAAAAGRPQPIPLRGRLRIARRGLGLILGLILCVPFHYLWRLLHLSSPWPKWFLRWAGYCSGARIRRIGTPLKRDVFYISNHCSWIDVPAIAGSSGTAFVAKAELRDAPAVGWLAGLNRTVFVERDDRLGVAEQINRLRDTLAENWSVTVFPEGTVTDGRSMLPFKPPLLKVLEPPPPGIMVQPVMLDYGEAGPDIGWLGEEHGRDNALRVLARRGSFPVNVHFLEPFHPRDFPGRKTIAAESQRRIREALAAALGHPVPLFVGHDVWSGKVAPPRYGEEEQSGGEGEPQATA